MRKFAAWLGVSQGSYTAWEMGRSSPSPKSVAHIAQRFSVRPEEISACIMRSERCETYSPLGQKLFAIRRGMGLDREQFAKRVGVTKAREHAWESSKCTPRPHIRAAIIAAYGIGDEELTEALGIQAQTFGQWIAEKRRSAGYTTKTAAPEVGYHRNQVSMVERDVIRPSAGMLEGFIQAYGLDPVEAARRLADAGPVARYPLGAFLVQARVANGKTISEVATALGSRVQDMQAIEDGLWKPTEDRLSNIAKVYGTAVGALRANWSLPRR